VRKLLKELSMICDEKPLLILGMKGVSSSKKLLLAGLPPDGRIRKLILFQVKSMSNLQKERLTMVGS